MRIVRAKQFSRDYNKLPSVIQKKTNRQIQNLIDHGIRYPALYAKKMQGVGDLWEARVNGSYRLTFQIQDDILIFRRVGTHEISRKP